MDTFTRARGPFALALVYLIAIALTLEPALAPGRVGVSGWLTAMALLAGVAGFSGFAANLVLGGRIPPIDRFFGGLEAMYRSHRVNGRIAYLFVAAHVLLIVLSRAIDSIPLALRLFTPAAGTTILLGVVAFVAMSLAIVATLYARLTHEAFIYVQRAFGVVFCIAAVHVFLTAGAKSSSRWLTIYLVALAAGAVVAFLYRSVFGSVLVRRYDYLVTDVRRLDDSVVEIAMEPVDEALNAGAGQFVFVTFYSDAFEAQFHPVTFSSRGESTLIVLRPGDARDQFHPFSLTSPRGSRSLSLAIKAVGEFTTALRKLEPGAAARVEGPYGEFSYVNMRHERQVWIAGGIGITPFLSMARSLGDDAYRVDLYWGVNTSRQAYFADELDRIAAATESFRFFLVVEETDGFISADMIGHRSGLDDVDILIVGPPAMERALRTQLVHAGVKDANIHSERFAFGPRR